MHRSEDSRRQARAETTDDLEMTVVCSSNSSLVDLCPSLQLSLRRSSVRCRSVLVSATAHRLPAKLASRYHVCARAALLSKCAKHGCPNLGITDTMQEISTCLAEESCCMLHMSAVERSRLPPRASTARVFRVFKFVGLSLESSEDEDFRRYCPGRQSIRHLRLENAMRHQSTLFPDSRTCE